MNVGIIGMGYVGLTLATFLAEKGHRVFGAETNTNIRDSVCLGKAHFHEVGLDDIIQKHIFKNLHVQNSLPESVHYDVIIITVGTPLINNRTIPNFDHIKSALNEVNKVIKGNELIILRSTVSVGVSRNLVWPFLMENRAMGQNLKLAMCPERTIEGKALEELQSLPQIIGGIDNSSAEAAVTFFSSMDVKTITTNSIEGAELVKLMNNTYRDTTFAIGNMFNEIAQSVGEDGANLIHIANWSYPRCTIPKPGFVAGPCLEKDAYILASNQFCKGTNFVIQARDFNKSIEDEFSKAVYEKISELKLPKRILISGMAFKGRPATSDLRGSSSIHIVNTLIALGFEVGIHDFEASHNDFNLAFGRNTWDNKIWLYEDEIKNQRGHNYSALVILNNHKNYESISSEIVSEFRLIFDAWDVLPHYDGIEKFTLSNYKIKK
jgi:nucleotide sugar dehydrogenase